MEDSLHVIGQHSFSFKGESFEGFHDGISDSLGDYAGDRMSPSADQVYVPFYDMDTKWRSISLAHPPPALFRSHGYGNDVAKRAVVDRVEPVKGLSKKCQSPPSSSMVIEVIQEQSFEISQAKAPSEPFLLMPTHFLTSSRLDVIKSSIKSAFCSFPEISFDTEEECSWNAIYLRGSTHCKIQINVYSRGATHVVEGNRLSGDGAAFRSVFAELKSVLCYAEVEMKSFNSFYENSPAPASGFLSDEEVMNSLKPLLQMAKSDKVEAQLEAARMLCDLSVRDDIQQQLVDSGCLAVLVEVLLPVNTCEQVSHHALLALANISEAQACQIAMIEAGILPALLLLATDGPYNTAEVRREAARILANLSSRMAARVVEALGHQATVNWIASVDHLLDDRLKLHASRAKLSLMHVITMKN